MLLKSLTKAGSLAAEAKRLLLAQIKDYASYDIVTVRDDRRVVEQVQSLMEWKIDFIVVKDQGKVVKGVIGRDQLGDIVREKILEARAAGREADLKRMSFRDLLQDEDFKEYYVLDEGEVTKPDPQLWQGLPPREVLIVKDKAVKAVVDRRWFRRWQSLLRRLAYVGT